MRYLSQEEKKKSIELWKESFPEDSDCFIEYYYREKGKKNHILAEEEGERITSMLHRNPYTFQVRKRLWKCDYIVGVATAEDRRRRGLMRKLMLKCLEDMYEEKMPFCFLMPADERYYLPFDFTYICRHKKLELLHDNRITKKEITSQEEEDSLQLAAEWMNDWLSRNYQVYTCRNAEYLRTLLLEIESEKGIAELLYENGRLAGICGLWGTTKKEQRMLLADARYTRQIGPAEPHIMGRIVCLPEFVRPVCLSEQVSQNGCVIYMRVKDPILLGNSHLWRWHLTHEGSTLEICNEERVCEDIVIDIQELTSWLFGYGIPGCVKKYADKIRTLKNVFIDEVV